jgi:hypothetical protein
LGVSVEDAAVAAALAEGSVGRGVQLAEAGILEDRRATLQSVAELSLDRPAALFDLAASWSSGGDASSSRSFLDARLDLLASWYRDVAVAAGHGDLIHSDLADLCRRSATMGRRRALQCMDAINEARGALALNAGARLTCEKLLVTLTTSAGHLPGRGWA